jgi:hypothetical protein
VVNRNGVNRDTTNEELAKRLFQRDNRAAPSPKPPTQEPLASRREPPQAPQTWKLGHARNTVLMPVTERERKALFVALSKGTKANLGRDPTVSELVLLVDAVDHARALVSATLETIEGRTNVYLENGKFAFRTSGQAVSPEAPR